MLPGLLAGLMSSGGGGGTVAIIDRTVSKTGSGSGSATATVSYNSDGTTTNHVPTTLETWLVGGVNSDYEIRATAISGTVTSGTMNTWQALTANRAWSVVAGAGTNESASIQIEMRRAASPFTVLDSANVTLQVFNV